MRTGTTANWTSGTGEIAKPSRTPYFNVDVDFYGSEVSLIDSGSLYHDDFSGTTWPSWLTYGTTGAGVVTRGGGTARFQSSNGTDRAYAVTGSVGVPNSGLFVVRTKGAVTGTGQVNWLIDNWDYGSQPIPTSASGQDPDVYFAPPRAIVVRANGVVGSVAGVVAAKDYIGEAAYDGTKAFRVARGSNMGTLVWGSHTHAFGSSWWGLMGDVQNNAGLGTLTAKYFSVFKGTNLKVGNLGSGYVAQLYGSDDNVIGSAQSTSTGGTVTLAIASKEYPLLGYVRFYTGTSQGSQISRYPESTNGSLWGGDVYKLGTGTPECNDISEDVTSLRYRVEFEDALTGYVPSGAISGDMDVTLKTGSKYSYFNTSSPLHGIARLNRDVRADTGFDVSGTSQYLRAFTGLTSEFQTSASEREAQLKCLDKSELLKRKTISWPILHNIPSDYIVRAVLAEAGISDGQTNDNQTAFMCKFDNSTTSEGGIAPYRTDGTPTYGTGKWDDEDGALVQASLLQLYYTVPDIAPDTGTVAFWFKPTDALSRFDVILRLTTNSQIHVVASKPTGDNITWNPSTGTIQAAVYTFELNNWYHVCVTWDSSTGSVVFYVNGVSVGRGTIDSVPTESFNTIFVSAPEALAVDHLSVSNIVRTAADVWGMYDAASADDDQTDLDPGFNTVEWLYVQEKDAWELIKEVCLAEGGRFYFDAEGRAHFENRHHLIGVPHNAPVKTIAHDDDMVELNLIEDIDSVINRCVARARPLSKQTGSDIWNANDIITIPANGTRVFWASLPNPAVGMDTSFTGTYGSGQSKFQASRKNWTGKEHVFVDHTSNVGLFGTAYSQAMKILGTNKHSSKNAYLCGTDGSPYVYLWGSSLVPAETKDGLPQIYAVTNDSESQGAYGTRSYEIDNDFISNLDYAEFLSKYTVMTNKDPRPRLDDVTIMADPRVETGDRVTVTDASGNTGLDNEFWTLGIDNDYGPPWTQTLKLTYAAPNSFFILDHETQGRLDLNVLAF